VSLNVFARRLDVRLSVTVSFLIHAGVAKSVYAPDSKSGGLNAHVGSSPTSGTNIPFSHITYLSSQFQHPWFSLRVLKKLRQNLRFGVAYPLPTSSVSTASNFSLENLG
jgi:hypothetical protein